MNIEYNSSGKISQYTDSNFSYFFTYSQNGIQEKAFEGDTSVTGNQLGIIQATTNNQGNVLQSIDTYYDSLGNIIPNDQSTFTMTYNNQGEMIKDVDQQP